MTILKAIQDWLEEFWFPLLLVCMLIGSFGGLMGAVTKENNDARACLAHGYPEHRYGPGREVYCLRSVNATDEVVKLKDLHS